MSEKPKFTPGPWAAFFRKGDRGSVRGKDLLDSIYVPIPGKDYGSKATVLVPAWTTFDGDLWEAWIQCSIDDAHLITAAPALYERLAEHAANCAECDGAGTLPPMAKPCPACHEARQALALARGEEEDGV